MAYSKGVTKEEFITEIKKHQQLDNFRQKFYFKESKGCAVGCSIESLRMLKNLKYLDHSNHNLYEEYLGIPRWLAHLEDKIFEMLSIDKSKEWPLEFSEAINTGSNLDQIKIPFLVYLLEQNINNLKQQSKCDDKYIIEKVIEVNKQVITALKSGDEQLMEEARSATFSHPASPAYPAYAAAYEAAYDAVDAATYAATYAATSAVDKAYTIEKYKNKLLELIRDCK